MIDHFSIRVRDYDRSKQFYEAALKPLGYRLMKEYPGGVAGLGDTHPDFWISAAEGGIPSVHVAFVSRDRATVDAFYRAALDAGAKDNGPPGLRPDYHPNYYGAFVLDPDGHNIEAVCHTP